MGRRNIWVPEGRGGLYAEATLLAGSLSRAIDQGLELFVRRGRAPGARSAPVECLVGRGRARVRTRFRGREIGELPLEPRTRGRVDGITVFATAGGRLAVWRWSDPDWAAARRPAGYWDGAPHTAGGDDGRAGAMRAGDVRAADVRADDVRAGAARAGDVRAHAVDLGAAGGLDAADAADAAHDDVDDSLDDPFDDDDWYERRGEELFVAETVDEVCARFQLDDGARAALDAAFRPVPVEELDI